VELAQLRYRLPRLLGFGKSLSRLGAGIGTRGPGEKKLETDRRHIKRRMHDIEDELAEILTNRSTQRAKRQKTGMPVVALVGYTNSGKSALMNRILALADKEAKAVDSQDMLFATLDTHHRSIRLDTNQEFLLVDTVGFVSKLPHSLVKAFKATLEEVVLADLLLHVVDAAAPDAAFKVQVTDQVLEEIGAGGKEKLYVYNKIDLLPGMPEPLGTGESVAVSALTGQYAEVLLDKIKAKVFGERVRTTLLIPYDEGRVLSYLCEKALVLSMEHTEEGTLLDAEMSLADYSRVKDYESVK
jgi:GTP-binding protein HflX